MKNKTLAAIVVSTALAYSPMSNAGFVDEIVQENEQDIGYVMDNYEEVSQPIAGWWEDAKKLGNYLKQYGKEGVDEFCDDYPGKCRWARKNYRKVKKMFE